MTIEKALGWTLAVCVSMYICSQLFGMIGNHVVEAITQLTAAVNGH